MKDGPVCETCYDRENCELRPAGGQHLREECDFYFPDVRTDRTPTPIRTPEDRRQPMETRD